MMYKIVIEKNNKAIMELIEHRTEADAIRKYREVRDVLKHNVKRKHSILLLRDGVEIVATVLHRQVAIEYVGGKTQNYEK